MSDDPRLARLINRFAATREVAARAQREHPNDTRAQFGAGVAYRLSCAYPEAINAFQICKALHPNDPYILFELAYVQEIVGDFAAAMANYEAALACEPGLYKAHYALVQLQKQTRDHNRVAELERSFDDADDEGGWRRLHLGHALAKCFEDLGDVQQSFAWLVRAKQLRSTLCHYSDTQESALNEAAMRSAASRIGGPEGFDSREPIFVVGLPRSGTTLIDRILSAHPDVMSAGELGNFPQLFKCMARTTTPVLLDGETFAAGAGIDFAALGRHYIDSTRPVAGHSPRFVDKAPGNYALAAIILRALPNARVICMHRAPMDLCLGNYRQIFPTKDMFYDYVYDLADTARKVVRFEQLARHWQAVLAPDRFLLASYEDLVADQRGVTERLLAFCGLSWDDACLSFHENSAPVATPSAAQVRQPLYGAAVGRWRRYGALLDPAYAVLRVAGLA